MGDVDRPRRRKGTRLHIPRQDQEPPWRSQKAGGGPSPRNPPQPSSRPRAPLLVAALRRTPEVGVGRVVDSHLELRHVHDARRNSLSHRRPRKRIRAASPAAGTRTIRVWESPLTSAPGCPRADLLFVREAYHMWRSVSVHRSCSNRVGRGPAGETGLSSGRCLSQQRLADPAVGGVPVGLDCLARRPSRALVADGGLVFRIDSALEEDLVAGVHAFLAQPALDERVDVEGGKMALVKADRIAKRDGPRLVCVGRHRIEEVPGTPPVDLEPVHQSRSVQSHKTTRCYYVASGVLDSDCVPGAPSFAILAAAGFLAAARPGARDGEALPGRHGRAV